MTLTPAFLDELRARTPLSALVGKSVKLTKAGREYKGCCPFHQEKTPSFYVNDDKGFYHCFGCSAHGDAIRWMTDQRGLPFIDAVKELAAAAGLDMPEQDRASVARAERAKGLHDVMQAAADWFESQLGGVEGSEARALLERRGIRHETAKAFGMGYAPDARGKLRNALKDFGDAMLVEAGLLIQVDGADGPREPYDRFRGRLMIPIRDPRGRVIAFGGRVIGAGEPKYLNSPDTPLFDKGRTLYNLDRAAPASRKANRVIVVEGYMDVIALAQAGFDEAVAPLGTALTEAQLERLWRLSDVPVLCFDGDSAGQKAAIRAAHRALPMLAPGRSLAFVTLPPGQDPDDIIRDQGRDAIDQLLGQPQALVDHIWANEIAETSTVTPESRAGLGAKLRGYAKEIRDEDVRTQYLATFNRMVWDHFHPERPSNSFRKFKPTEPRRPVAPRLLAIAQHGIDQVTIVPAVIKGLLRFSDLIAPLAESINSIPITSIKLRQTREALLNWALGGGRVDSGLPSAILEQEGRRDVLVQLESVTLAFSFVNQQSDPEVARRDLTLAIDCLAAKREIEHLINESKSRQERWSDEDFSQYIRYIDEKAAVERIFIDALMWDDIPA